MNEKMCAEVDIKKGRQVICCGSLKPAKVEAHRRLRRASKQWVHVGEFEGSWPKTVRLTWRDVY